MAKRDSSGYKKIQEEMRALAQFPDENPNPIFRIDPKGTILYANSASLHLLYAWDCEMGKLLPEAFFPTIQEVFSTGYVKTVELENLGRIYSFSVAPVAGRNFAYLYGQDITERRRLDQLKDDFISAVSHELRMPLTIVKGAISNLQDGIAGALKPEQLEVIEVASRNINRLTRLVHELLDLSRLESGKAHLNQTRVDAAVLLKQLEKDFKMEAKKRGLVLHAHLPAKLPDVYADPELIHQVLSNLLDNALRFAKSKITVEAEGADGAETVTFRVQDDGKGISLENQKRLFSKFYQVERVASGAGYRGTGLGLSLVKEIVDRHGGKIWVESAKNQGTTFCFTLQSYRK